MNKLSLFADRGGKKMTVKALLIVNLILVIIILISLFILIINRKEIMKNVFKSMTKVLLTDHYSENLFELIPAIKRQGVISLMENQLRTEHGEMLQRSLGTSKQWHNLESLTFIPAQTKRFLTDKDTPVD